MMGEKSPMSSRGQCVELPPIPGSSQDDSSDLRQSFERVLQHQDNLIKSLVDELSEMEQQSELARTSHRQKMDNLVKFHMSQLEEQALDFKTRVEELRSEYDTERELILSQHQQEMAYLNDVTFFMEKHYAKIDDEARRDYESSRKQIKKQYKEEYQEKKKQTEEIMKKLRREQRREPPEGPEESRI